MMKSWQYRTIPFADRVTMHVVPDPVTGCHNFTGRLDSYGYAQIKDKGKAILVHRWAWSQINGPVPDGLGILHKCDNRSCINPDHLYAGDQKQNMADMFARGRQGVKPSGRDHKRPMAKLTESQVIAVKVHLAARRPQSVAARRFNVSPQLINDIAMNRTWQHLNIRINP